MRREALDAGRGRSDCLPRDPAHHPGTGGSEQGAGGRSRQAGRRLEAMLERIVQVSRAAAGLRQEDVYGIIRTAHAANTLAGLSGGLIFLDGWFAQVLEGAGAGARRLPRADRPRPAAPRHRAAQPRAGALPALPRPGDGAAHPRLPRSRRCSRPSAGRAGLPGRGLPRRRAGRVRGPGLPPGAARRGRARGSGRSPEVAAAGDASIPGGFALRERQGPAPARRPVWPGWCGGCCA